MKSKIILLLISFLISNTDLMANETICFTWKGSTKAKTFYIKASHTEQFTVEWGDGADIETLTGADSIQSIHHNYADTNSYTVRITGLTADCLFTVLFCSYSQVTHLDVSRNTALEYLDCSDNRLTALDLSKNTKLQKLRCYKNLLTNLDVSTNAKLWLLECNNNLLSNIQVKANTELLGLDCSDNQLTSLELKANAKLQVLWCFYNQLISLDLNANTRLLNLDCSDNQLTSLELNVNTKLEGLACFTNRLQLLDLYKASEMVSDSSHKRLGQQRLAPQEITKGGSVDYSAQKEFAGSSTDFYVEKNGNPAHASDYSIDNGIITFNNAGNYRVIMTNPAIVSHKHYPARVIGEVHVTGE